MYSPTLGSFLSRDPLPQAGVPEILSDNNWFGHRLTMMRNLYGYGDPNPMIVVDPSGMACESTVSGWPLVDPLPRDNPTGQPVAVVDGRLDVESRECSRDGSNKNYVITIIIDSSSPVRQGQWAVRPKSQGFFDSLLSGAAELKVFGLPKTCVTSTVFDKAGRAAGGMRAIVSIACGIPCGSSGCCEDVTEAAAITYFAPSPFRGARAPLISQYQQLRVDWRIGLMNKTSNCAFESCSSLLQINAWPFQTGAGPIGQGDRPIPLPPELPR